MQQRSLTHDGWLRRYSLWIPEEAPPSSIPLVVFLHGAGGTGEWAGDETNWTELAQEIGFAIAYPEGLAINPDKPPKFLTNPQCWNDGSGRGGPLHAYLDDVGFLERMLDAIIEDPRIDRSRIYFSGFSNGAGMVFRLASVISHRIAAIAPVAGHLWIESVSPEHPLPTIYIIGDMDPLIPIEGGTVRTPWGSRETRVPVAHTLQSWARAIGCDSTPRVHVPSAGVLREEYCSDNPLLEFTCYVVQGLGHHWPGGKGMLGERIGGKIVRHFDATRVIWNFFRRWERKSQALR